ncbi:hypothetical protein ABZT03_34375, partial [Streptomyces sp. NPDC005574]
GGRRHVGAAGMVRLSSGTTTAAGAGAGAVAGAGASAKPVASATSGGGSRGAGVALAIAGGLLVLLAAGAFLVNRRWPLPDLVRRRR